MACLFLPETLKATVKKPDRSMTTNDGDIVSSNSVTTTSNDLLDELEDGEQQPLLRFNRHKNMLVGRISSIFIIFMYGC